VAESPAGVQVREETLRLPTYVAGEPEANPMFYFGRASQGAEGRVYPYPLYDTLTDLREERDYRLIVLENEFVRLGILPEIGGRLFEGIDKGNGYHFLYRQHVIKPALIGLIGAWISGGIEWNIPHHHRATTFLPVQHRLEKHADGSQTVWVGELELRHRTRWAVGYTLHPGKSYFEARLRLLNRTPLAHTLLCFANVAVHVDEHYQVIFPPRTRFVTHHHKREFTTWPIATTRYGGYDFRPGVDVSWFKNHVAANSMFAWNYEDDFLAGYDHGRQAGLLSVADHHIVPGKKLWTWGNGPRGRMWDKILTDDDGPYIELMVGAYSDNQPDYSWLQPGEVKSFSIFWYPFQGIGGVKHANLDAAVNLEVTNRTARLGFCTTSSRPTAQVRLADRARNRVLFDREVPLAPSAPFRAEVALPPDITETDLRASLSVDGQELIAYTPLPPGNESLPEPVQPPRPPSEIATVEELYLTGLRIEQFHYPNLEPEPYWEEALRRDPGDARVNTALGIRLLKAARYDEAEGRFRQAIVRLTAQYTTPKDAEPIYYLGVTLKAQERPDEAFTEFYRATWSAAWRGPAFFGLAEIATLRGNWLAALDLVDRALEANALDLRAQTLRAALLRHLGRAREALAQLNRAQRRSDPLDVRVLAERWLTTRRPPAAAALTSTMLAHPATALETAAEYLNAGLYQDGYDVLAALVAAAPDPARVSPLVEYYLGEFAARLDRPDVAASHRRRAQDLSPAYVFPFQAELIPVLRRAMHANPADARAPYYLGNLLFDWQPAEAVKQWEQAARLDPSFAIVHRNLGIAYSHQPSGNALDRAIASLERAVALPEPYPLHCFELDQLYAAAGVVPDRRLAQLERHVDRLAQRDDALSRYIALLVLHGRYQDAIGFMTGRKFEVWEGGSLSVADHWVDAHVLRGRRHLAAGRPAEALADFQAADQLPDNLPSEDRGRGGRVAEVAWWVGSAQSALGQADAARESWTRATRSRATDSQRYYQGRAFEQLDEPDRARALYRQLIEDGQERLASGKAVDFFASFGEQQSQRSRQATAHGWIGLGHLGLAETAEAEAAFARALAASPDHLEAVVARQGFAAE
jgi:tetratricopeptide (TPR) repeat protein